jgi:sec-independent protein translocase protein TatB
MFDLTSSKLLILAIVALIVVGPKDLPLLLRTVGKYLGVIRRHANEFRAQLDEAIREAELHELKKEFEDVGRQVKSTMEEGARAIDTEAAAAKRAIEDASEATPKTGAMAHNDASERAEGAPARAADDSETVQLPEKQLPEKTGT